MFLECSGTSGTRTTNGSDTPAEWSSRRNGIVSTASASFSRPREMHPLASGVRGVPQKETPRAASCELCSANDCTAGVGTETSAGPDAPLSSDCASKVGQ